MTAHHFRGTDMRSTLVTLLAVVACVFITACGTPQPAPAQPEKTEPQKKKRRLAPPESNCKFEAYCEVIDLSTP
jgi:hypothetical protein